MTQVDLLQRTIARLILQHPFLATLALRLVRIDDPTVETAWTDGVHLAANPTWFGGLADEERVTLVAHEVLHLALAHHLRRGGRDLARWNHACDYAVNALLVADGFKLPPGLLYDPSFGEASAEAIYNRLVPDRHGDDDGPGDSPPAAAAGAGSVPSGAGASSDTSGSSPPQPRAFGEVRDQPFPSPPTPAEQKDLLARHAVLITALEQQARAAGRDSAGARRAAAVAARGAWVDWRNLLAEFLGAPHTQDYSWRRPNARYAGLGLYIPVLEASGPRNIAFVLDTSGSVPAEALEAVSSELEAYLAQYPAVTLHVLYEDAAVTGRASYTSADLPLRLEPRGGGGTNFGPVLALLEEDDEPPACIVYFTDLVGRFPTVAPAAPVLWLVFGQPLKPPTVPFGR